MTSKQHGEQGTGKHPHKDTAEPYPHHEASSSGENQSGSGGGGREQSGTSHARAGSKPSQGQGHSGGGDESLKEREYRDEQGNVHHHTKTYMEQHEGKK